jgi:two-component sensor histidine kinase
MEIIAATSELVITWVESGGPAVHEPENRGFGNKLMQVVLPTEPKLEFRPAGVVCELRVPLPVDG